jgi:CheY-specific phosphatase CheX
MLIADDALYQIIQDTWSSTLDFQVDRVSGSTHLADDSLTVCVRISGAWEGEVRLHCPLSLARRIAAAIFQVEAEKAPTDEILDALSELVHIVAGNLKTFLPQPVTISLPTLPDPTDWGGTTPQWQLVNRLKLECQGYPFVVTLLGDYSAAGRLGIQPDGDNKQPQGNP